MLSHTQVHKSIHSYGGLHTEFLSELQRVLTNSTIMKASHTYIHTLNIDNTTIIHKIIHKHQKRGEGGTPARKLVRFYSTTTSCKIGIAKDNW